MLDETHVRVGEAQHNTLVSRGETAYVVVDDTTKYARRYDMIACTSFTHTLPPIIYTPEDRHDWGSDGVNWRMFEQYIIDTLAPAVASIDLYPLTLVVDKANIHTPAKIKQALIDGGCQNVANIIILPTQAGKRMSPLDNALFHTWKTRVKQLGPTQARSLVQVMADEWDKLPSSEIRENYRNCALMRGADVYRDCPDPRSHQHNNA